MSKIFEQYPEQSMSFAETEETPVVQPVLTKRELDILKKLAKQLKKFNKRQKKDEEQCAVEREKNETQKDTADKGKTVKVERGKNGETFLSKLGNVFLKVLPSVLRTVINFAVPTVLGYIFRRKTCTV